MLNQLQIIGNLGADPELRYTPTGAAVCNFPVATTERWKDSNGDQQERTEWHSVVAWRGLADVCAKYLHKGKQVYISGRLQTRSWTDQDGAKRYKTEVIADTMKMLGSAGSRQDSAAPSAPMPEEPSFNPDDDIPF